MIYLRHTTQDAAPSLVSTDSWRDRALCHVMRGEPVELDNGEVDTVDPSWWVIEHGRNRDQISRNEAAKRICDRCPVRKECLADDDDGVSCVIRGSLEPSERSKNRRPSRRSA